MRGRWLAFWVVFLLWAISPSHARVISLYGGSVSANLPGGTKIKRQQNGYIFLLRPLNGFSPNVNVTLQPYRSGLRPYAALSKRQFRRLGFNVLHQRFFGRAQAWDVEYTGIIGNRVLHFYARAFKVGNGVLLWTATIPDDQWDSKPADELIDIISSIKFP